MAHCSSFGRNYFWRFPVERARVCVCVLCTFMGWVSSCNYYDLAVLGIHCLTLSFFVAIGQ